MNKPAHCCLSVPAAWAESPAPSSYRRSTGRLSSGWSVSSWLFNLENITFPVSTKWATICGSLWKLLMLCKCWLWRVSFPVWSHRVLREAKAYSWPAWDTEKRGGCIDCLGRHRDLIFKRVCRDCFLKNIYKTYYFKTTNVYWFKKISHIPITHSFRLSSLICAPTNFCLF